MKTATINITNATAPVTVLTSPKVGRGWIIKGEFPNVQKALMAGQTFWHVSDDAHYDIVDVDDDMKVLALCAAELHDKFDVVVCNDPTEWIEA